MSNIIKSYKNIDAVVADFLNRSRKILHDGLMYGHDLGAQIHLIESESKYGDGAINELSTKLAYEKSTLYSYQRFYEAYPDVEMVKCLADNNIVWRVISNKLLTDRVAPYRALLNEKLLSGEIDREGLEQELERIQQIEDDKKLLEEGESQQEIQTNREAPEEAVKAAREVKKPLYKITKLCEQLETALHDSEAKFQDMDLISDNDMYESVKDVMQANVDTIRGLFKVAEHWKDRVLKYAPEAATAGEE